FYGEVRIRYTADVILAEDVPANCHSGWDEGLRSLYRALCQALRRSAQGSGPECGCLNHPRRVARRVWWTVTAVRVLSSEGPAGAARRLLPIQGAPAPAPAPVPSGTATREMAGAASSAAVGATLRSPIGALARARRTMGLG